MRTLALMLPHFIRAILLRMPPMQGGVEVPHDHTTVRDDRDDGRGGDGSRMVVAAA